MNKWKIKKKAEESNVLNSGTFNNDAGTWKEVLNETKDITILGIPVKINIWHYEVDTNDERYSRWFNSNTLHYTIVNEDEVRNKLNSLIKNQFKEQLSQFGSDIRAGRGFYINFPAEGDFII